MTQQNVILVPGKLLLLEKLLKIGVRTKQGSYQIGGKFHVGVEFLLGRIELTLRRFDAVDSFFSQRLDAGEQEKV